MSAACVALFAIFYCLNSNIFRQNFTRPLYRSDNVGQFFAGESRFECFLAVFKDLHHRFLMVSAHYAPPFDGMRMHREYWWCRCCSVDVEYSDPLSRSGEPAGASAPAGCRYETGLNEFR